MEHINLSIKVNWVEDEVTSDATVDYSMILNALTALLMQARSGSSTIGESVPS